MGASLPFSELASVSSTNCVSSYLSCIDRICCLALFVFHPCAQYRTGGLEWVDKTAYY